MDTFFEYFKTLFSFNSGLGSAVLIAFILLLVFYGHRLSYKKHVDTNGKVVITPRFTLPKGTDTNPQSRRQFTAGIKPFSLNQRRVLSVLYAGHEALFGVIVVLCGLTLISAVLVALTQDTIAPSYISQVATLLMGILAIPLGILFIVLRNADNPFKDR